MRRSFFNPLVPARVEETAAAAAPPSSRTPCSRIPARVEETLAMASQIGASVFVPARVEETLPGNGLKSIPKHDR
jgi:hypothetical protein